MKDLAVEKNLGKLGGGMRIGGVFELECYDSLGKLKWSETTKNLVLDPGLNELLDLVFNYTTPASWYVGIMATATTLATGDTLASHAGWVEESGYTGDRKIYTVAAADSESVTNTAAKATFVFTTNATVNGAFVSQASAGTSGVLFCEATFSAKVVSTNDTLEVTYTISADDDGV